MKKYLPIAFFFAAAGCAATMIDLPSVIAVTETTPVASTDDAADDPAVWINQENPAASLILGTDKQKGVNVYDLQGALVQFVPSGRVNNIDVRQKLTLGDWRGDIAAASNRTNNTVTLYEIKDGELVETGAVPSFLEEPYGLCLGAPGDELYAFVAYKTGDLIAYRIDGPQNGALAGRIKLATQLEGCVYDDDERMLYIGEEERGVWKAGFEGGVFSEPQLIDEVTGSNGIKGDVEGLALYHGQDATYLIASSQGNNSYAVYDAVSGEFVTRFAIADGAVDGTQETDGIEAVAAPLGPQFPNGLLIVQDGRNAPAGQTQNFKLIDWREIERLIGNAEAG